MLRSRSIFDRLRVFFSPAPAPAPIKSFYLYLQPPGPNTGGLLEKKMLGEALVTIGLFTLAVG